MKPVTTKRILNEIAKGIYWSDDYGTNCALCGECSENYSIEEIEHKKDCLMLASQEQLKINRE